MKHGSDDMPMACCLTSAELGERAATILAQFRSAVIGMEELQDGYAFRLPGDRKWIATIAKWIATIAKMIVAERECCPFLTFGLIAQPGMGPVIVRVTGPAGAKDFSRTLLSRWGAPSLSRSLLARQGGDFDFNRKRNQNPHPPAKNAGRMGHRLFD
jgi:hypothetical protein